MFIGLNPSTASADKDDPTLRRLLAFCDSWGYGNLLVLNLFARVTSSPYMLRCFDDPIGDFNDFQLVKYSFQWAQKPYWDLFLGWGVGGALLKRNLEVFSLLEPFRTKRMKNFSNSLGPLSIGLTGKGHPRHPLYLPAKSVLTPFLWK